jgi:hypothetical protein
MVKINRFLILKEVARAVKILPHLRNATIS